MIRRHRIGISVFVILWMLVFHYETLRLHYLSPLVKRELPKLPLLFPPAGWIMFFHVDNQYGLAEVYGLSRSEPPTLLDPHEIFATRAIGYDNIHRNVLIEVLSQDRAPAFCRYLERKFPGYESFAVAYAQYPDVVQEPERVLRQLMYRCPTQWPSDPVAQ